MTKITRRQAMVAATATAAILPLAGTVNKVSAALPQAKNQMPGVHRIRVGGTTVTAILDGYFDLDASVMPAAPLDQLEEIQRRAFLPVGPTFRTAISAFVVNTDDELVLIDTGLNNLTAFGPNVGMLLGNLAAAGIDPGQIDRVILTHMHPDHIAGLADADGNAVFEAAPLHVHEADWNFWTSEEIRSQAPEEARAFFDIAVQASAPYKNRLELFKGPAADLGGGIEAVHLPGHTPGHIGLLIGSGNDQLMIITDVVHAVPMQFAHPEWAIAFDTDQDLAIATRRNVFDQLVTDRMLFTGMHMPFPGFGHVDRSGDGYAFVPAPWQYEL